jgi:predicted dehydrogenase
LEKLLATDLDSLDELSRVCEKTSRSFWVNCPMPFCPHYATVKKEISQRHVKGPLKYSVRGGNYGLVTNFIHYLDHFFLLAGAQIVNLGVHSNAHVIPSKRMGYSELLGKMFASTVNGDELVVEFVEGRTSEVMEIEIRKGDFSWKVDEFNLTLTRHHLDQAQLSQSIYTPRQSDLTHLSLISLDSGHKPHWANFGESTELHRKLLEALDNHLGPDSQVLFT